MRLLRAFALYLLFVEKLVVEAGRGASEGATETDRSTKAGIFNTTLAFTIPLFSFSVPTRLAADRDYTNQAAFSLLGLALVGGLAAVPFILGTGKGHRKYWRISGRQANEPTPWMSAVLEAADRLGVDGRQCVLRSICEAHQQPQRYGYLVLPVHLLTMRSNSRSDFNIAADYGRQEPIKKPCHRRYHCLISIIEATSNLINYIYPST